MSPREEVAAEDELFRALLSLQDLAECRAFLQDLCTPAELQALKDRWAVAECLAEGLSYRQVHDRTGVSLTTISRVARFLTSGAGGYQKALERLKK
ncbi:MAG: helix-turn-helix domain-containing protein [Chromatiales bacterium]|nr:MAG: helix-turn-helix domain-containing protein [Chromatiales bacterium]